MSNSGLLQADQDDDDDDSKSGLKITIRNKVKAAAPMVKENNRL